MTRFIEAGLLRMSGPDSDSLKFCIDRSSRLCEGHFEGAPILPGVAHIALAMAACAERRPELGSPQGVRNIRFARPLRPGDEIDLELSSGSEDSSIRFEIRAGKELATSGLLLFAPGRGRV